MRKIEILFFAVLMIASTARSSESAGRTAGMTLLKTVNARTVGLGQGFTGVDGGIDSLGTNPAGVASLEHPALSATYLNGFVDDNFGLVSYAHAVGFGSLYASVAYYDGGSVDLVYTGGLQETKKAQQDQVGQIGVAFGKESPLSFGGAVKGYQFTLAETADASGFAADAGLLWRTPLKGFSLGASVLNMGDDLQYEVEKEPIPQTLRAGAAWDFDFRKNKYLRWVPYRLMITADAIQVKNQDAAVGGGLEMQNAFDVMGVPGSAFLRGGYNSGTDNATVGVGFLIGNFDLDYALNLLKDDLGVVHRVTMGWSFAPLKKKKAR